MIKGRARKNSAAAAVSHGLNKLLKKRKRMVSKTRKRLGRKFVRMR